MNHIRYRQKGFLSESEILELQEENREWAKRRSREYEHELKMKSYGFDDPNSILLDYVKAYHEHARNTG